MKSYIEKREILIQKSIDLTKEVYPCLLNDMNKLTNSLETAEPNSIFVNNLLIFIEYCEIKNIEKTIILYTIINDLEEFERNKKRAQFYARSRNYITL